MSKTESERLAGFCVHQLAGLLVDPPAGVAQKFRGFAQVAADVAAAVGRWRFESGGQNFCRQFVFQSLENFLLFACRQAGGRKLGVVEETPRAFVHAVKQRLIGPFEVQSIGNGLANAAVSERGVYGD